MSRVEPGEVAVVHYGNLLEDQLSKWQGGGRHPSGIAEYISNSDDSYRRMKKFSGQSIEVEIHSKKGRQIDRLVIRDFAEGMSFSDLENKFFHYFESRSGREDGAPVSGRFGTGGKAYAIMNFKHCWITSVKDVYCSPLRQEGVEVSKMVAEQKGVQPCSDANGIQRPKRSSCSRG